MTRALLIFSYYAPSLGKFSIVGGRFGIRHVSMPPPWLSFGVYRENLLLKIFFFTLHGTYALPLFFGRFGWKGIKEYFKIKNVVINFGCA